MKQAQHDEHSLRDRLEAILPLVQKPGRYTGNEVNIVRKDPKGAEVQVVLAFPDVYESGLPNLGLAILYHLINRAPNYLAERAYLPWPDMEARMREAPISPGQAGIPLFTLESFRPVKGFDILGITLQYELCYTNVLALLSLADIPIHSEERGEDDPLVIAGGHCAGNPEPMAPFMDAFVIGDGEEAALEILNVVREAKAQGLHREERLRRLASVPGVYVPKLYEAGYDGEGKYSGLRPRIQGLPGLIEARRVRELKESDYPERPLVPLIETTHDRLAIEIHRGCTRGCRFCQAGMITRPVRERSTEEILRMAQAGIKATGWDEVSLLSLSTTDHSTIRQIVEKLNKAFADQKVAVSVPSLRADQFSPDLAGALREIKKGGLTFAPEAGTQRLRNVINKGMGEEDLLRSAEAAFEAGWPHIKLYFMTGLPTETDEDLQAIADLVQKVERVGKRFGGKACKVSLSGFVPKPHTPFEAEEQAGWEEAQRKIGFLVRAMKRASSKLNWHDPKQTVVEGLLARGDRKVASVIERAWRAGAKFDEWSEHFKYELWEQAVSESGLAWATYLRPRGEEERLPWEHITYGVRREFLAEDKALSRKERVLEDCRTGECYACGLACELPAKASFPGEEGGSRSNDTGSFASLRQKPAPTEYGRSRKKLPQPSPLAKAHVRLKYRKGHEARFISHLDVMRVFTRAIRRAGLPIAYSQGYSPHPKMAFGPPLPLGMTSRGEYLDMEFSKPFFGEVLAKLNQALPEGIQALEAKPIFGKATSLSEAIVSADYEINLDPPRPELGERIRETLFLDTLPVVRSGAEGDKVVDIRPLIEEMTLAEEGRRLRLRLKVGEGGSGRVPEVLGALGFPIEEAPRLPCERAGLHIRGGEGAGGLRSPMEAF